MLFGREQLSTAGVDTVFIGDSITQADSRSTDDIPGELSWVRYVVTDDRTPWRFRANVAIGGQTLVQMAARFERDVLSWRPQSVVIMGGTNDAIFDVSVDRSLAALSEMVSSARAADLDVWVIGPPPLDFTKVAERRLSDLVDQQEELVTALGAHFVSIRSEISERQWRSLSLDGVHPTQDGAREIARIALGSGDAG